MNLHHVLTSTRRFRADETFFSFPNGFSNLSNSRFRSLIGWIQAIKLRKREFDRLEKIQPSYQLTSCLSKMQRKNEVMIVFCFFYKQKTSFFQKHSKSARQTHFFKKMTKIFYLMVDFFNKFYELEMKICAKEARRLKSKIGFRRLVEKIKKRFWTFWQYEVYGCLKKWWIW